MQSEELAQASSAVVFSGYDAVLPPLHNLRFRIEKAVGFSKTQLPVLL
jgi:hypothetical protein